MFIDIIFCGSFAEMNCLKTFFAAFGGKCLNGCRKGRPPGYMDYTKKCTSPVPKLSDAIVFLDANVFETFYL